MKILHVFKTYLPDTFTGIERVIWEIAEGLTSEGVETHVLTVSGDARSGSRPIGQHFVHQAKCSLNVASTPLSFSLFKDFRRLAPSFDVIHYHYPWPMMDLLHLASGVRRPSIVTYHSDIVRQSRLSVPYRPIMHRFLASVDSIVATSPNYVRSSPVLQRYLDKVETIPIGMSETAKVDSTLIDKWRCSVGDGFFLFVGALRYYKGLPFLLEAAECTGLPVVIVGKGKYADEIKRRALPSVTHLSDVSDEDKLALLSLCKAFVFPSHLRSEAFGVALAEAARAGRPMISCEIGTGTSFVNRHGETGLVVPPADPDALGRAMREIDDRPEMAAHLGQAARAHFENHFRAEQMCAHYLRLYQTVTETAAFSRVRAHATEPGGVSLGAPSFEG